MNKKLAIAIVVVLVLTACPLRQAFPHILMKLITWSAALFIITSIAVYAWDYTDRSALAESGDGSALASTWHELSYGGDYDTAITALERKLEVNESEPALQAYARLKFLTGDSDSAVENYLKALERYPQSPLAEIYMYKALILLEDTNSYSRMVSTLERLLDNPETPPYLSGRIAIYLNDLYRLRGDYDDADTMLARYNPITDWQIIGPFDNEGKHGLDAVYGPENGVNLNGVYEGKEYDVALPQRLLRTDPGNDPQQVRNGLPDNIGNIVRPKGCFPDGRRFRGFEDMAQRRTGTRGKRIQHRAIRYLRYTGYATGRG